MSNPLANPVGSPFKIYPESHHLSQLHRCHSGSSHHELSAGIPQGLPCFCPCMLHSILSNPSNPLKYTFNWWFILLRYILLTDYYLPNTILNISLFTTCTYYYLPSTILNIYLILIATIWQVRKQKHKRFFKYLVQGHMVRKWQHQDSNKGSPPY